MFNVRFYHIVLASGSFLYYKIFVELDTFWYLYFNLQYDIVCASLDSITTSAELVK